ncbi:LuxR C-terminal-related transcriptional regulator [Nonomuraea sp. NPDC050310]|uniref:ATP-binding protein n=1 Tax=Nonomuraea sp. NPDC050310 TaxID=3154935 RepID=UPI00340D1E4C
MSLATHSRQPSLPVQVTGFVGRRRELELLEELLSRARLVTLSGPGGVGKTRLALRAAEAARDRFPDGVHLVELSALSDAALLARTVAGALGLPEQESRSALEQLVEFLSVRQALVILDTCEHLVEECALLVERLLRETVGLCLLVTSRQPLDVAGEHMVPVPPLPVEDGEGGALALFEQRAAAVVPGFAVTEENRAAVRALCARLDGMPLAIELASVRLRAIPLQGLLARLEDRFSLLTVRRGVPRHQTLRTTIMWSHDLCLPEERVLWGRLSVFAGSFDLAAVEAVCSGGVLAAGEIVEHLVGLVDKSMVMRTEEEGRYRLLDTMRELAGEQVDAAELVELRQRHLEYFTGLAGRWYDRAFGDEQVAMVSGLGRERANLRAALEFAFSAEGDAAAGARLAYVLWPYWLCAGALSEACYWYDRVLVAVPAPVVERAMAVCHLGWFRSVQGEREGALGCLEAAGALAAELGDAGWQARALMGLGMQRMMAGDAAGSVRSLEEAAGSLAERDPHMHLLCLVTLCAAHVLAGDLKRGLASAGRVLQVLGPDSREAYAQGLALYLMSLCRGLLGEGAEALRLARQGLRLTQGLRDQFSAALGLDLLGLLAVGEGRMVRAARLHGAAEAVWARFTRPLYGLEGLLVLRDQTLVSVEQALGAERFELGFAQGRAMGLEAAIRLGEQDGDAVAAAVERADLGVLSAREREVAGLLAEGLTNRQIAERLVISKRTADAHVEHIFAKLGVSSRAQVAALVVEG